MNKATSRNVTKATQSAMTRDRLLDAAYRILRDQGHAGLRSANVSSESGVSRGGMLHHYPTKELLVAAVYERIVDTMEEESWKRIRASSEDEVLSAIVKDAQSRFVDDAYKITLDILIASSKEKPLAKARKNLAARHQPTAREGWAQRLAATGVDAETAGLVTGFLWDLVKGIALRNTVHKDEALNKRIIKLGLKLARDRCAEVVGSTSKDLA